MNVKKLIYRCSMFLIPVFAVFMFASFQQSTVFAAFVTVENDGSKLIISGDGEITQVNITEYQSSVTEVTIKNSITRIGDNAFNGCTKLQKVTFEDKINLEIIGNQAFLGCTSLTNIEIPASVGSIGESTFNGCTKLQEVTFEDGINLESIGKYAFLDCTSLTNIEIPASVGSIGDSAFNGCTKLQEVTFEDRINLESIGNYAFFGCTNLTSITIPDSVKSIGYDAFLNCTNLKNIKIPNNVTEICNETFSGCTSLTSIEIPASVGSIGDRAFAGCTSLIRITIPDSVGSIGNYAFLGCTRLTNIEIPNGVGSIGNSAFLGCTSLIRITIPASVRSIGENAFKDCKNLRKVEIEANDSDLLIAHTAFEGCSQYLTIIVPCKIGPTLKEFFPDKQVIYLHEYKEDEGVFKCDKHEIHDWKRLNDDALYVFFDQGCLYIYGSGRVTKDNISSIIKDIKDKGVIEDIGNIKAICIVVSDDGKMSIDDGTFEEFSLNAVVLRGKVGNVLAFLKGENKKISDLPTSVAEDSAFNYVQLCYLKDVNEMTVRILTKSSISDGNIKIGVGDDSEQDPTSRDNKYFEFSVPVANWHIPIKINIVREIEGEIEREEINCLSVCEYLLRLQDNTEPETAEFKAISALLAYYDSVNI